MKKYFLFALLAMFIVGCDSPNANYPSGGDSDDDGGGSNKSYVVTGEAKDVTHKSVTLYGEVNVEIADYETIEWGIMYSADKDELEDRNGTMVVCDDALIENAYRVELSDLVSETQYYYCAYINLNNKQYKFGETKEFTTLNSTNSTEPQYSPEIYTSYFYVNPIFKGDSLVSAKDTLSLSYDSQDGSYELDTVYIGDTINFASAYYTVNSDLVAVKIDWDTLYMNLWYDLTEDIEAALTSETQLETGRLYFVPGYNRVSFPISFSPIKKGGMTLKLTVESTSEFSSNSVLFYIPAVEHIVDGTTTN